MDDEENTICLDVVEFLNSEFGNDISNLNKAEKILKRISRYEQALENEVNPANMDPDHMLSHTKHVKNALTKIKNLANKHEELHAAVTDELKNTESVKLHFTSKMKELKETEHLYIYLQWILKTEEENSRMEELVKTGLPSQVADCFVNIKSLWEQLQTSQCTHLVEYIYKTMIYWHGILLEKFSSEFQKVLSSLNWPVLSTNLSTPFSLSPDVMDKFNQLFLTLHKIALPSDHMKTQEVKDNVEDPSLLLPLQLMLQPLQKRFFFHFMGKKPTNRLDKPEWYLTQILTWISDHTTFLEKNVQPLLDNEHLSHINARMQLMKGLVNLAIVRLKSDLRSLLDDDHLLSHTIDEIILFTQELNNQGYPQIYPNVIQVLSDDPYFSRWKSLEHQSALEKMDKFLSLDSAWRSRYQDESDIDDMQVPESAELFVTLLLTMTERYSQITDKDRQISFLELQLELLDDFRLRLHQLSQCEMQETIQANYCGIMNAVNYIINILEEWNNLPFFLQVYAYKKKKDIQEQLLREMDKKHVVKRKESKSMVNVEEEILENSVFDDTIGLYQHMLNDLLHTMCDRVMLDVKAKSRPYRKEKWFCMPVQDKKTMEVSIGAYPMLEIINTSLHSLQELLAKPLFTKVWQQVASELNIYLYEEVILQNNFSEGGAAQLNFDMTRNLFPIFGAYTLKPDKYFKLVRDSCILLNLSNAPAMLLKETLKCQESFDAKTNALEELGVYSLSPSQALLILSQRNYANL